MAAISSWWDARKQQADWWLAILLFLSLLTLSPLIYQDYGIAWDELPQRSVAVQNTKIIQGEAPASKAFRDADYGPLYEVALETTGQWLGNRDFRKMTRYRHLMGYLLYVTGLFAFYGLVREHYGSRWFALVGVLLLLLMPRFFAHAFFNSKDLPFLVANIWGLYILRRQLDQPHWARALLLGAVLGWTINLRIAGVLLLAMSLTVLALRAWRRPAHRRTTLASLLVIPALAAALNYATWPYLWHDPVQKVVTIWTNMSHFRWDSLVLFQGKQRFARDLPWYYLPTWIAISTPIPTLLLCLAGLCTVPVMAIRRWAVVGKDLTLSNWAVWWGGATLPIGLIVVQHSVVYDGWRHVYFCFPYLLLLGLVALHAIWQRSESWKPEVRKLAGLAALLSLGPTLLFMIAAHPFQQVYFNALLPHREGYLAEHYERDYWGSSTLAALRYIAQHDPRPQIRIYASHDPVRFNWALLDDADRKRLKVMPKEATADYFVFMSRPLPDLPPQQEIVDNPYTLTIQGSPVVSVFELGPPQE